MRWAIAVALAALATACTTPLQQGERLYREGDRLGALETWRGVPDDAREYERVQARVEVVEAEFERLVVQYKQRARYYEGRGRLAESILNYRLALKLQPDDAETLAHVQQLARDLAKRRGELQRRYREAFARGDLATARRRLAEQRVVDPLDPELETDGRQLQSALGAAVERRMTEGRQSFASGAHAASKESFRAVLAIDPDNESARGYLSYIATLQRESEERATGARERTPLARAPGKFASDAQIRAEGFYQNALSAESSGDPYAAIRGYLRALGADPEHTGAARQLQELRGRLAVEVPALIEAGRTAFRSEDLQTALDLWRRALLVDPQNERVIAYIGRAEQQLQNLERLRAEPDAALGGT